jgi:predicted ATPase
MTKTVVELDLQGYSDVALELEEHLSADLVLKFNDQLQEFVDAGLSSIAVPRDAAVMAETGDGAILAFDDADTGHSFAEAVHAACRMHNHSKTVAAARRWFRIGIATGELAIDSAQPSRIGGIVIARAVRLEASARIGEVVIDPETYAGLNDRYKSLYGQEEVILGKRQEQFRARRYIVVHGLSQIQAARELKSADDVGNLQHEPLRVTDYQKDSRAAVPRFLTQFIGREDEVRSVEKRFSQTRLLTLTGTGGIGKTRLAARVADAIERTCADGVWWIDLAPLSDPALVIQTVASELGLREQPGVHLLDTLLTALATKHAVVVLDGCEHLVDACAELVEAVLHKCPRVNVLVTSNEPLRLPGETLWSVPPLAVPDIQLAEDDLQLRRNEAISLFVDRAARADPAFAATDATIRDVAQVCQRLDGIPLAIELAASRVRVLSVKEILGKLEHLFRLLTGGERRMVPRHQTLRATVEWSYDLATAEGKLLFNRLGVFAGGWTLDAAETICSDNHLVAADILDVLGRLVDKSLVVKIPSGNDTTRYRLLETLRHYAVERLISAGEIEDVRRRHATFYLELAERAQPLLRGQDQVTWLRRLEDEHDNLRAAFEWWKSDQLEMALRFGGALGRFWHMRGYWTEGRIRLSPLLDTPDASEPTEVRAKALVASGHLAFLQRDFSEAQRRYEEALSIRRNLGDRSRVADSLHRVGILAEVRQEYEVAWSLQTESLSIGRGYAGANLLADILHHLGGLEDLRGNAGLAKALKQESLDLRQTTGDRWGEAWSLIVQGNERRYHGDYVGARDLYERGLDIYEATGDKRRIAYLVNKLGLIYLDSGDLRAAEDAFGKSLNHARQLGIQEEIAEACANIGRVAHARGSLPAARAQLEESIELLKSNAPENDEQNYDLINAWPGYYDVGSRIEVVADAIHSLGLISLDQRDIDNAHHLFRESFELQRSSKKASPDRESDDARYLDGVSFVAAARGDHVRALQLAGAADAIRERLDARLPPGAQNSSRLRLSTAWQTLGPVAQNEWLVGRSMSSVDAVALAESITSD